MNLLDFQEQAAYKLSSSISDFITKNVSTPLGVTILEAPTGSGKTLITSSAIKPNLEDACFIWLSYFPNVNKQSLSRLLKYGFDPNALQEITSENAISQLDKGSIYFVNFQKLKPDDLLMRGGDIVTSYTQLLQNAVRRSIPIIVIIDEAHIGSTTARAIHQSATIMHNQLLDRASYPYSGVIGISATVGKFQHLLGSIPKAYVEETITIPYDDPRDSKLLKAGIEVDYLNDVNPANVALVCIRESLTKYKGITEDWAKADPSVNPLYLVQVEDKFDSSDPNFLQEFIHTWHSVTGYPILPSEIRHTFSGGICEWGIDYIDPQNIEEGIGVKVVFFKMALSTGWDCPRAEMLISLRPAKDITNITQLVGRMLRNPKGLQLEHPDFEHLDIAYLFLPFFNREVVDALKREYEKLLVKGVVITKEKVVLKPNPTLNTPVLKQLFENLEKFSQTWKGKNLPARVLEFQYAMGSKKFIGVDNKEVIKLLDGWVDVYKNSIYTKCKEALSSSKIQEGSITLNTQKPDGTIETREVVWDKRDAGRMFRGLKEQKRKLMDGVTESILDKVNDLLRDDFPSISYPIVILSNTRLLDNILKTAITDNQIALRNIVDSIKHILRTRGITGQPNKDRRKMIRMVGALIDLDSTTIPEPWTLPGYQTCMVGDNKGKKSYYVSEDGCIGKLSGPEKVVQMDLESDPEVVAYVRNPQKSNGLSVKYLFEGKVKLTFPDFIVIKGDISSPHTVRYALIECKGGQNLGPDQYKYEGLQRYISDYQAELPIKGLWIEVIDGVKHVSDVSIHKYSERLQGEFPWKY